MKSYCSISAGVMRLTLMGLAHCSTVVFCIFLTATRRVVSGFSAKKNQIRLPPERKKSAHAHLRKYRWKSHAASTLRHGLMTNLPDAPCNTLPTAATACCRRRQRRVKISTSIPTPISTTTNGECSKPPIGACCAVERIDADGTGCGRGGRRNDEGTQPNTGVGLDDSDGTGGG